MPRPAADRVKAVWNGTGTGQITLGGAAPGEPVQAFPSALDGQVVSYLIRHETALEAEAGYGVYTHSGATLSRLYRTYPVVGGSAVAFSTGTKFVAVTSLSIDIVPNLATVDPTVNDGIGNGFLNGQFWVNTNTPAVFVCRRHAAGAADWIRIDSGAGNVGTVGIPATGNYAQFTDATNIQGRTVAQVIEDVQAELPTAIANYRGEGDEALSEAFDAKANVIDIPGGNLAAQDEADLPDMTADFRGSGDETMLAAFMAVSGAAGLIQVDDSSTTVTIGSSTNGTLRFLLSDSAISVSLLANCPEDARVLIVKAGGGTVTVSCQAAQAAGSGAGFFVAGDDHGGTKSTTSFTVAGWAEFRCRSNTGGDSSVFLVEGSGLSLPSTVTGTIDFTTAGIKVPNGSAVSGTLTVGAHGGGVYKTAGNCTLTPAAGFTVTLLLGGAHTIGAGGTAHSPASGDTVSVVCFSATNGDVKLFKTAAASVINLPTA